MFQYLRQHKLLRLCLTLALVIAAAYGAGRLYYQVTGGFLVSNIMYDVPYDARWETAPLTADAREHLQQVLDQPYSYLGKGCQSYVFASADGQYVLKFFKYQRFRPQEWLSYFSFIPPVEEYRLRKIEKKRDKLEGVFTSWKLAYEHLQPETGIAYVHLNKTSAFDRPLTIYDKIGLEHHINLNETEFLVQRRATMLCPTLEELMQKGSQAEAEKILAELVAMLVWENSRGFADNDHALMQNTGVIDGHPVHIDVGQFIRNPIVKNPDVYHQEIFNKTYKFRKWLKEAHPTLAIYFDAQLEDVIGDNFKTMKPVFYTADMARIPNA